MMQISSTPEAIASSPMIWMTGLVSPSRSTSGNISFFTAADAGYWRVPRPAAVITALRTLRMGARVRGARGAGQGASGEVEEVRQRVTRAVGFGEIRGILGNRRLEERAG